MQISFSTHREALLEHGVWYPPSSRAGDRNHRLITREIHEGKDFPLLSHILRESPTDTVLLSHEGLSNQITLIPQRGLRAFRELTSGIEKEIVLVSRNQASWTWSFYKQCMLSEVSRRETFRGSSLTLAEFSEHPHIQFLADTEAVHRLVKRGYGARRVVRVSMDTPRWFENLMGRIGLGELTHLELPRSNDSVPDWIALFLREINQCISDPMIRATWIAILQKFAQTNHLVMKNKFRKFGETAMDCIDPALLTELRATGDPALTGVYRKELDELETFLIEHAKKRD